jgi:LCP family protein required for cell wall assembly
VTLAVLLGAVLLVTPPSTPRPAEMSLVRVRTASAVADPLSGGVVWVLCLGSDARPGQRLLRERADAIQLVGLNLRTGAGTMIGVPRDSYVEIRGHGRDKINASMTYGGPQLMADSVARLVGVRPDYVFTTGFDGFRAMVRAIGGVTVHSRFAFSDPVRPQGYHVGRNRLTAFQALIFGRVRHPLPRGDFDRSANQEELLRSILRRVRSRQSTPGFMERGLLAAVKSLDTDLGPARLFRLAQAVAGIDPAKLRGCVITGATGYAGAASVVYPDNAQARRVAKDVRRDATLDHPC